MGCIHQIPPLRGVRKVVQNYPALGVRSVQFYIYCNLIGQVLPFGSGYSQVNACGMMAELHIGHPTQAAVG